MYATRTDIEERYGADLLAVIADVDGDGVVDDAVVERALADASGEVDTYVSARYSLPLPSVPTALVRVAVDIAVYRIASTADRATEEQRTRYEDAVALLARVAKGTASLGIATHDAPATSGARVVATSPRRYGGLL